MDEIEKKLRDVIFGPNEYESTIGSFCDDIHYIIESPREMWHRRHPMDIFAKWMRYFLASHIEGFDQKVLNDYTYFDNTMSCAAPCLPSFDFSISTKRPDWYYYTQDAARAFEQMYLTLRAHLMYDIDVVTNVDPKTSIETFLSKIEDLMVHLFEFGILFKVKLMHYHDAKIRKGTNAYLVSQDKAVRITKESRLNSEYWDKWSHKAKIRGKTTKPEDFAEAWETIKSDKVKRGIWSKKLNVPKPIEASTCVIAGIDGARCAEEMITVMRILFSHLHINTSKSDLKTLSDFHKHMATTLKVSRFFKEQSFMTLKREGFYDIIDSDSVLDEMFFILNGLNDLYDTANEGASDDDYAKRFEKISKLVSRGKGSVEFEGKMRMGAEEPVTTLETHVLMPSGLPITSVSESSSPSTDTPPASPEKFVSGKDFSKIRRALKMAAMYRREDQRLSNGIDSLIEEMEKRPLGLKKIDVRTFLKDIGYSSIMNSDFYKFYIAYRYFSDPVYYSKYEPTFLSMVRKEEIEVSFKESVKHIHGAGMSFLEFWKNFSGAETPPVTAPLVEIAPPESIPDAGSDSMDVESTAESSGVKHVLPRAKIEHLNKEMLDSRKKVSDATWSIARGVFAPLLDYFLRTKV